MKRLPLDDTFKVNRNPVTLREIVLDKLRSAIMNFQLLPGDRLVERDLCDRLGVSRTSVREALRHLESEGLVEFADAKGPRVAIITLADACDIYELRCVLEGLIVQLFTLRAKPKDIRALEKALEENRQALKEGELQQVIDSVQGFYDVLLEGSGNHVAATQLRQLQARISYLRATSVSQETAAVPATRKWSSWSKRSRAATHWQRIRRRSITYATPRAWRWNTSNPSRTKTAKSATSSPPSR